VIAGNEIFVTMLLGKGNRRALPCFLPTIGGIVNMDTIAAVWVAFFLLLVPPLCAQDQPPGLSAAVQAFAEKKGDPVLPPFRHALTDLDGDGRADAVVLLQGRNWCGSGGCTMLVFHGTNGGFRYVSGSTITREPIRISADTRRGWKTLIVYSKGKGDVLMRFNGKRYPLNPSSQPKATPEQVHAAHIVME
jgi:hypothetical protein